MAIKWNIDKAHSQAQFRVKHMVISTVTGEFLDIDASAESEDETFKNANFEFSAQIDSIDTRNEMRDNHLKSEDFFSADEHPELVFKGNEFDGDTFKGDLTIRGVTKKVELDVDFGGVISDANGKKRAGFEITGQIDRKDFGLNWSAVTEAGGLVVADKVKLFVNLEMIEA